MDDYIDRDEFLKKLGEEYPGCPPHPAIIVGMLADYPPADVRPVVRGRWRKIAPYNQSKWECSNCHQENKYAYKDGDATVYELQDFFCPYCGADMREV